MKRKKLLLCALFLASTIVLGRILSIRTSIITIGFSFVPIMLSAILLGPKYSTFIATISDIIGALLFPTGSYFVGFTITAFLTGLTYGLILYRKDFQVNKSFFIRLIISTVIVSAFYNGLLNTIWIMIINQNAGKVVVLVRIVKQLIMVPIEIITITSLAKLMEERFKKIIND